MECAQLEHAKQTHIAIETTPKFKDRYVVSSDADPASQIIPGILP